MSNPEAYGSKKLAGGWEQIEKMHPHKTLIILSVFGSSLIFLFMLIAFTASIWDSRAMIDFRMPRAFTVSAFLLLVSSFFLMKAHAAYTQDRMNDLVKGLNFTLIFGLSFAISQFIGWWELDLTGIKLSGALAGSYIYVLSGLHFTHLIGGLIFLYVMHRKALSVKEDPVASFIFFANPYERVRLDMLSIWWHFMDILWLVLFFYFLFVT